LNGKGICSTIVARVVAQQHSGAGHNRAAAAFVTGVERGKEMEIFWLSC